MRPSMAVVSLLLLLLLATTAQGIRLEGESLAAFQKKLQEEEKSLTGGGSAVGGVVLCIDDGHCSGRSRKLMTKLATATPKSTRSEGEEADDSQRLHLKEEVAGFPVEPPFSNHKQSASETYPDILDIAGMDYSPAKKKPPIHN